MLENPAGQRHRWPVPLPGCSDAWPPATLQPQPETASPVPLDNSLSAAVTSITCEQLRGWVERCCEPTDDPVAQLNRWVALTAGQQLLASQVRNLLRQFVTRFGVGVYVDSIGALWQIELGVDQGHAAAAVGAAVQNAVGDGDHSEVLRLLGCFDVAAQWRASAFTGNGFTVTLPWLEWREQGLLSDRGLLTVDADRLTVAQATLRAAPLADVHTGWVRRYQTTGDVNQLARMTAPQLLTAIAETEADADTVAAVANAATPVLSSVNLAPGGVPVAHWWPHPVVGSQLELVAGFLLNQSSGVLPDDPATVTELLLGLRRHVFTVTGLRDAGLFSEQLLATSHGVCRRVVRLPESSLL